MNEQLLGQFCPLCDEWIDIASDIQDGEIVKCINDHSLVVEWTDSDFEDFHLWEKHKYPFSNWIENKAKSL